MIKKMIFIIFFIFFLTSCDKKDEELILMQYDSDNLFLPSFTIYENKEIINVNKPLYLDIYQNQTSHKIKISYYTDIEHEKIYTSEDLENNNKIYVDYDVIINDDQINISNMINDYKYYENEQIKINYYLGNFNGVYCAALEHQDSGWFDVAPDIIGNIIFSYNDSNNVIKCYYDCKFYDISEIYDLGYLSYNDVIFINVLYRYNMSLNLIN